MIFKDDFPAAGLAALCLALLFAVYAATGWLVVRLTGAWCPFRVKRPLIPLIGYAATTLLLFYIHLIVPMAGMLPAVGILPALAGAGLWLKERRWGRVTSAKTPAPQKKRKGPECRVPVKRWLVQLSAGLALIPTAALVIYPYLLAREVSAFGILNNDVFYYAITDWRMKLYSYGATAGASSPLAATAEAARRWGINYGSVMLSSLTGLREWQSVQIAAFDAVLLLALSGYAAARVMRAPWLVAGVCGLLTACNHFVFRYAVDGWLGFISGLPLLVGILVLAASVREGWRSGILPGILFAALLLFYCEVVPIAAGLTVVILLRRFGIDRLPWRAIGVTAALAALLGAGTLPWVLPQIIHSSKVAMLIQFFYWSDVTGSALHLLGLMESLQYATGKPVAGLWQFAGAALVLILLIRAGQARFWRHLMFPASLLCLALVVYLVFVKGQQYQGHRLLAATVAIGVSTVFACLRKRLDQALLAATAVLLVMPAMQLGARAAEGATRAGSAERELGGWLKALPRDGKLLLDVPDDMNIYFSHWMYLEALRAFDSDEKRIVFPRIQYSYLSSTPELGAADLTEVKYVVRSRAPGRITADLELAAVTERYTLLRVPKGRVSAFSLSVSGFHPAESGQFWMEQNGRFDVWSSGGTVQMVIGTYTNPALKRAAVEVLLNGKSTGNIDVGRVNATSTVDLPMRRGKNTVILHSEPGPVAPGDRDTRKLSIRVTSVNFVGKTT